VVAVFPSSLTKSARWCRKRWFEGGVIFMLPEKVMSPSVWAELECTAVLSIFTGSFFDVFLSSTLMAV